MKKFRVYDSQIGNLKIDFPHRAWDTWAVFEGVPLYKKRVLEVGAFPTFSSIYPAEQGAEVIASDSFEWWDKRALNYGVTKQGWKEILERYDIKTIDADVISLPFYSNSIDVVFGISMIEHVRQDVLALEEMVRVLKPGGIIALTTEISEHSQPYNNYGRVYDSEELRFLLATSHMSRYGNVYWPDLEFPDVLPKVSFGSVKLCPVMVRGIKV